MISFQNVSLRYPLGNIALDEVSFDIKVKDFIYLVGPSGAGKTTLLRMLIRETLPTSGKILVDEVDISSHIYKQTNKLRQKIGIVFQDFKIIPDKNIFENVAVGMLVKGFKPTAIKQQVREALDLTGISKKEQMFPAQLSAGELQRVAIARAIIGDRNIILADEPTGNLDPQTTWEIMKIFKRLETQKTILFATHNTDVVNSMKRRVIVLKNGRLFKDIKKGGYEI